jgi:putative aldouronate transport system permease protein
MDGAGEMKTFLRIALPMSFPLILAVGILLFIYRWNDWFTSMLYVNDSSLYTLQYYLQRIDREEEFIRNMVRVTAGNDLSRSMPIHTLRFAMGVISTIPLLFLTPLFKKATTYCNFSLE